MQRPFRPVRALRSLAARAILWVARRLEGR